MRCRAALVPDLGVIHPEAERAVGFGLACVEGFPPARSARMAKRLPGSERWSHAAPFWGAFSLMVVMAALSAVGCTSFHRAIRIPNVYRVQAGGNPLMEQRTREHLESLLTSPHFSRRGMKFGGDVVLKPVPAVRRDEVRDRSGGLTVFTGRLRPVVIVIAVLPDGTWDDRTLEHEAAHAILLWNGIAGHPAQYRGVVPLWD